MRSLRLPVRLSALLTFVLALGACVPMNTRLQRATAGVIGCPAEEIAISNFKRRGGATWDAECRGRSYVCSGISGGESIQVACAEDASTTVAEPTAGGEVAPPAPDGCVYDTQCKGDRICEEGRCVSPPPPAPAPEPPTAEPAE